MFDSCHRQIHYLRLSVTDRCNLRCRYCMPDGAKIPEHEEVLTYEEFLRLAVLFAQCGIDTVRVTGGEPLVRKSVAQLVAGLKATPGIRHVSMTTNGTLLEEKQGILLNAPALHKVNISLHAFEANDLAIPFETYLSRCFAFGQAAQGRFLVVYRLWNGGGAEARNREILNALAGAFPGPWDVRPRGTRLAPRTYLEYGDKFDWPDLAAPDGGEQAFCYGLRDQIGVLCDGTVVPCCLDHEGDIALGNLFESAMDDILESSRAQAIYRGFANKKAAEELCRKCGYARRFL